MTEPTTRTTPRATLRIEDEDGHEYPVRVFGSDVEEARRAPVRFAAQLGFRRIVRAQVEEPKP